MPLLAYLPYAPQCPLEKISCPSRIVFYPLKLSTTRDLSTRWQHIRIATLLLLHVFDLGHLYRLSGLASGRKTGKIMNYGLILFCTLAYLAALFGVAYWSEKRSKQGKSLINNPIVYALSLAVYCTAWTFYGSVGRAATGGIEFLTIYLGPTLMAPLWIHVLRKITQISQTQRLTSIADFISSRYGKSAFVAGLVAVIAIFAIVPYIALQLKAIAFSFDLISQESNPYLQAENPGSFYTHSPFYIALILALFTIAFGARHLEAPERHEGLVAAIAFESIVKLFAISAVGVFVLFWCYQGPADLMQIVQEHPAGPSMLGMDAGKPLDGWSWFWLMIISMLAVLLLPRQFHIAVVENTNPKHILKAIWLFPLYLLLINVFVVPIAAAGVVKFGVADNLADSFVLALPLAEGQVGLALLAFIGGVSAATSMVIVATIALSIMASNHLVVPLLLRSSLIKDSFSKDLSPRLHNIRRGVILAILMISYLYYRTLNRDEPLVSIGLISFTAVAQFAPALLGGIYWRGATRTGAITGMIAGFLVWLYTLPLVNLLENNPIIEQGPWGWAMLRPQALFGLEGLEPIPHAAFWSLFVNVLFFVGASLYTKQSEIEQQQAQLFTDIFKTDQREVGSSWESRARLQDIQGLLSRFLGQKRSDDLLKAYLRRNNISLKSHSEVGSDLINYSERLLAGAIGSASSRFMISTIVKQTPLTHHDMMEVLDETQQLVRYSRELEKKSLELERATHKLRTANQRLREMDQLKDDFIATVTHELRTPITSIRAVSNILNDNPNLVAKKRQEFLNIIISESARISRLINQVLDLEKMESGHAELNMISISFSDLVRQVVDGLKSLAAERQVQLEETYASPIPQIKGDWDRLTQVVINVLSNAIKFAPEEMGRVDVVLRQEGSYLYLQVADNGPGIDPKAQPYIFDKFTQFHSYKNKKQGGSGLGLSISWRIVHLHGGQIDVQSELGAGSTFTVKLPLPESN